MLSFREQGPASPFAVVFVPGPADSWRSYETVLSHMDPAIRCVAVSQRGHGDSNKPTDGYDIATFAADLVAFLDERGVESAALVGHSGSCFVVRRVALDHPERVAALVLEASPLTLSAHPGLVDLLTVVRELDDPVDAAFVRNFVSGTAAPGIDVEPFVHETLKVPARVWRGVFEDLATYDDTDELASITAPVLLIWGDRDELVARDVQGRQLAGLQTARLVVYEGAGHTPRWEAPARFAADVSAFARSL